MHKQAVTQEGISAEELEQLHLLMNPMALLTACCLLASWCMGFVVLTGSRDMADMVLELSGEAYLRKIALGGLIVYSVVATLFYVVPCVAMSCKCPNYPAHCHLAIFLLVSIGCLCTQGPIVGGYPRDKFMSKSLPPCLNESMANPICDQLGKKLGYTFRTGLAWAALIVAVILLPICQAVCCA
jgi:hypothetical protein